MTRLESDLRLNPLTCAATQDAIADVMAKLYKNTRVNLQEVYIENVHGDLNLYIAFDFLVKRGLATGWSPYDKDEDSPTRWHSDYTLRVAPPVEMPLLSLRAFFHEPHCYAVAFDCIGWHLTHVDSGDCLVLDPVVGKIALNFYERIV
jgi:hypothetical protein